MSLRQEFLLSKAFNDILSWNKNFSDKVLKVKWQKMAVSPFTFFRGTNHLFWNYFANDKRLFSFSEPELFTWIQGDLHCYNYGIFSNDKGDIVYDLNDFDEAFISDFQWDLWRMAVSIDIVGRENTFKRVKKENIIASFVRFYLKTIYAYSQTNEIPDPISEKTAYGKLDEILAQTHKNSSRLKMVKEWTSCIEGTRKFDLRHKKLEDIEDRHRQEIVKAVGIYAQKLVRKHGFTNDYFQVLDVARRLSTGIGSLGNPRYYVLIRGKEAKPEEHVILDIKFQTTATGMVFNQKFYPKEFKNHAQRHEMAYKAFNKDADNHLSSIDLSEGAFSVRERSPYKSYFPTQLLTTETRFRKLAEQWGTALAASHLRSSKDFFKANLFTKILENNEDKFIALVQEIAFEFSDFNLKAYQQFMNIVYLE